MILVSFQALKKSASFIWISALYIIKDALSGLWILYLFQCDSLLLAAVLSWS